MSAQAWTRLPKHVPCLTGRLIRLRRLCGWKTDQNHDLISSGFSSQIESCSMNAMGFSISILLEHQVDTGCYANQNVMLANPCSTSNSSVRLPTV